MLWWASSSQEGRYPGSIGLLSLGARMLSRVTLLLLVLAAPAAAQESSSRDMFRPRQWAAHFILGSFGGIGVSRFSSPTRAMLLQVNMTVLHREQVNDDGVGGQVSSRMTGAGIIARVGWRRYRPTSRRVSPYMTFGPLFEWSHNYASGTGGTSSTDTWGLGAFGDLGALYHVTDRLALSASGNADLRYNHSATESSTGFGGSAWQLQLSGVTISAGFTLLF